MVVLASSCGNESVQFPTSTDSDQQIAMEKWQRSCALCHVDGNGGAPRVGDVEAWQPRLAQSNEAILRHTVEGFGRMPPLGYCMDCTEQDFLILTKFMAGVSP
tara:strand:+ start:23722 stop:24030 length:309 start_codon:yes stop_codon:yes gene_type:complete